MKKILLLLMIAPIIGFGQRTGCISGNCNDGYGTYVYSTDGDKYVGEFRDGHRHGEGIYYWHNGTKYIGNYSYDNRNGYGIYIYESGSVYIGESEDGERSGQGTYIFGNEQNKGEKYVGEYKNGKRNGQGTFTYTDGTIKEGLWENGKFIGKEKGKLLEDIMLGCWSLEYRWSDCTGDWYDGENYCYYRNGTFDNNWEGNIEGTWTVNGNNYSHTNNNGTMYTGFYKDGIITGRMISYQGSNGCFKMIKE